MLDHSSIALVLFLFRFVELLYTVLDMTTITPIADLCIYCNTLDGEPTSASGYELVWLLLFQTLLCNPTAIPTAMPTIHPIMTNAIRILTMILCLLGRLFNQVFCFGLVRHCCRLASKRPLNTPSLLVGFLPLSSFSNDTEGESCSVADSTSLMEILMAGLGLLSVEGRGESWL